MEDALVLKSVFSKNGEIRTVLILVLMEDALVRDIRGLTLHPQNGLNPCFNGRCTRTSFTQNTSDLGMRCLNPCFNGRCTRTFSSGKIKEFDKES